MTEKNENAAKLVRSDALLEETLALLDKIHAVWMSDIDNDEFIDELDPIMQETKKFLEDNTSNGPHHRRVAKGEGDGQE